MKRIDTDECNRQLDEALDRFFSDMQVIFYDVLDLCSKHGITTEATEEGWNRLLDHVEADLVSNFTIERDVEDE